MNPPSTIIGLALSTLLLSAGCGSPEAPTGSAPDNEADAGRPATAVPHVARGPLASSSVGPSLKSRDHR